MSKALATYVKTQKDPPKPQPKRELNDNEKRALEKMRAEAKEAGATLASDGEGGLSPSLVLGVMRRDGFKCKKCGTNKNIGVHHKGGLENPKSKWLKKKGHDNDPNNLVTICEKTKDGPGCHDDIHVEDRKEGGDESREKGGEE
jgi:hypothetical protein